MFILQDAGLDNNGQGITSKQDIFQGVFDC